jgi:hypothetical protein
MQGFSPHVSLLPQGSGTITAMSGGGSAPLGLTNYNQFESQKSIIIQLSETANKATTTKETLQTFYDSLKDSDQYSKFKMEILQKVASAGILSSIKVAPDTTTHLKDTYSIRNLFENLKERSITIDNIDIRLTSEDLEIEIHSTAIQKEAAIADAVAAGVLGAAAGVPGAAAAATLAQAAAASRGALSNSTNSGKTQKTQKQTKIPE